MGKLVFYDKENDILSIHKGFNIDEKFKGNIDVGKLILDVSTKGRIVGLEIMNATNFLKEFDIEKKILETLVDAEFNASTKSDRIIVSIALKAKNIEQKIPAKIVVPLEVPVYH